MARLLQAESMDLDAIAWAGAEGEHEGHPLLIRFREFHEGFPRISYPERLNVLWRMNERDEYGWPTAAEFDCLEVFENRLVEAVEHDHQSVLSLVLTCNGQKEFVFHTADVETFLNRLTNMPQEAEGYPITIVKNTDPEWEYFDSVLPREA